MLQNNRTYLYLRDITQAYIQLKLKLNCNFYIRPPPKLSTMLNIAKGGVLKVVKPLYRVLEVGNYWFATYHAYYTKELSMD